MANVSLVYPALSDSTWNARIGHGQMAATFIHLGLAYLSSALKQAGHEVDLIDLRRLSGWEAFDRAFERQRPDILGVTMETAMFPFAVEACRRAKEMAPEVVTVLGGIHPTLKPQECLETGVIDHVLMGEGEVSFPELARDPSAFLPLFWGKTPDLDAIPFPDRELWDDYRQRCGFDLSALRTYRFPTPMIELITTRGCPWKCAFCCGPGEQTIYTREGRNGERRPFIRRRSVENVIAEIEFLVERYGARSLFFHDDQFIISRKWGEAFCQAMRDSGLAARGIEWIASCRSDMICKFESLFAEMHAVGLRMVIIGFESFSARVLEWLNKGTTVEQNFKAAEICKRTGVRIWANYILGTPGPWGWEIEDDLATVEALKAIEPDHYSPAFFTPIIGTSLHDWCLENDLILTEEKGALGNRSVVSGGGKIKGVDYAALSRLIVHDPHPLSPPSLARPIAGRAARWLRPLLRPFALWR